MKKLTGLLIFFACLSITGYSQNVVITDMIAQGIKLHDRGDFKDAIEMYKKVLVLNPASAQAHYEIASSYFSARDYENALKHSNKVIGINTEYIDQAYIIKGSAYDNLGKPLEALNTYKKGIEKYKTNYLLYYNLALTSFNLKEYSNAEDALQQSLKINPSHASSHFLLGINMLMLEERVKAILAIYNYLLLEPKSKRTASALITLEEELQKGRKKDNEKSAVTIPAKKDDDEFYTAELMLGLFGSSKTNETNKLKSGNELFAENTNALFTILGELKKDKKGFWWDFYVDYFNTLAVNKHTEAFCYYIAQSKDDAYNKWLEGNRPKIEAFSEWYSTYLHKF